MHVCVSCGQVLVRLILNTGLCIRKLLKSAGGSGEEDEDEMQAKVQFTKRLQN